MFPLVPELSSCLFPVQGRSWSLSSNRSLPGSNFKSREVLHCNSATQKRKMGSQPRHSSSWAMIFGSPFALVAPRSQDHSSTLNHDPLRNTFYLDSICPASKLWDKVQHKCLRAFNCAAQQSMISFTKPSPSQMSFGWY